MTLARLAALPLLAFAAGCSQSPDPRGVERNEVLVRIAAIGRAESTPDQANFSAGVSSIGATGPAAAQANARAMNRVIDALAALGIERRDIQTRQVSVNRLDYGPNRNRFEATNVVAVRVRKVAIVGEAIGAATGAGANVLSGPDLRVGDPEAARRSAFAAAFREARARADVYAAAAGLKVARVLTINDATAPGAEPMYDAMMMERAAPRPVNAEPPVLAGTNTDQASVTVTFALGPK